MKAKKILAVTGLTELIKPHESIYEVTAIIAKRAKQIAQQTKEELKEKLVEFISSTDNLEEVFENKEQVEIARFYERQPKPIIVAAEEFLNDQLVYRYADTAIEDNLQHAS